jgi:hypothetical protein
MEDTTMQDGSPGVFDELSFTICPHGLSENRIHEVGDALRLLEGAVSVNVWHRLNMPLLAHRGP